ncbi:MAG: Fur family transcriptional regulator [Vulcanimicrobiaceae bacterium]
MKHAAAEARLPKNYQLLWEIVREQHPGTHLTTSDIFVEAKRRRPAIGFSTVYRGLARLRELGLVAEVAVPGADSVTYENSGSQHSHFRCLACGRVQDIDYVLPRSVLGALEAAHGLTISVDAIALSGRCAECRTAV